MKTPKVYTFKKTDDITKYTVTQTFVASDFDVSLSKLYHKMNPETEILVEGKEYTTNITPYGYFKYKGTVWPVYDDDPGQQDLIYINGEFIGAGAYTMYPYNVETFIFEIDRLTEEGTTNEEVKSKGN